MNQFTTAVRVVLDDVVVDSILLVLTEPHVTTYPVNPAEFPLLRSIDPYGVTLFSRYQMKWFLDEWNRLEPTLDPNERDGWIAVRQATEQVAGLRDTFLEFVGD